MFKKVSIIGDGAMGTVLASLLCEKGVSVCVWGHDAEQLREIAQAGENKKFMPGHKIPDGVTFESRDEKAMEGADMVLSAVPCQYMRGVWSRLAEYYPHGVPIVSVAKGIENETLLRPVQILRQILGEDTRCVVLSGPTIADELARNLPATACAACEDEKLAKEVQEVLSTSWFRVYTNNDVVGVELAGAMKNVIAIAAGIIDGIGAGDNAKAALLSRGLAEIARLGEAMGARHETFSGLTGLGDLVTTCISPKGRNRSFGERIGHGQAVDGAMGMTDSVIEGVATCRSVKSLSKSYKVEMPIAQAVYEVLFEGKAVSIAINELMHRKLKAE